MARDFTGWVVFPAAALVGAIALLAAPGAARAETAYRAPIWRAEPRPMPKLLFENSAGDIVRLRDFRSKVVLLNIWATWCAACREEMPILDRLQARLGGAEFEVVALAIDRDGLRTVEPFFRELGLQHLRIYLDRLQDSLRRLHVFGIPQSILIDRQGREIARHAGPNNWMAPPLVRSIRRVIEEGRSPRAEPAR